MYLRNLGDLISSIEAGKNFSCPSKPVTHDSVGLVKISAVTWGVFDPRETKTVVDKKQIDAKRGKRPWHLWRSDRFTGMSKPVAYVGNWLALFHTDRPACGAAFSIPVFINRLVGYGQLLGPGRMSAN